MERLSNFKTKRHQATYRRIAEALRNQILSGKLLPGTRLPSTEEMGVIWQTSYFTIHKALMTLVKEGLLERLHGTGTFVAEPKNRFTCAGIYYSENIWSNEESAFYRSVHYALQEKFNKLKKTTRIFVDSRPKNKQHNLLPALAEAITSREIQCLIAPSVNSTVFPALNKLALPTAFVAPEPIRNRIVFDEQAFLRESLQRLAAQGCRSVGLITHIYIKPTESNNPSYFYDSFYQEVKSAGLTTNDHWVCKPSHTVKEFAKYGYLAFRKLWSLSKKPEGLIIFPDSDVRGAITAILEAGVLVPQQMRFAFHRNANVDLVCPFPAIWGISDEQMVADGLIQLIEKQFKGEKITPITIPYTFKQTTNGKKQRATS